MRALLSQRVMGIPFRCGVVGPVVVGGQGIAGGLLALREGQRLTDEGIQTGAGLRVAAGLDLGLGDRGGHAAPTVRFDSVSSPR